MARHKEDTVSMFNSAFWIAALERAVKTAAQSAILVLGADQVNIFTVSWVEVAGLVAGGFVLSILTSLMSAGLGDHTGPSLANELAVSRYVPPTALRGQS